MRDLLKKHRELLRFAVVGGTIFSYVANREWSFRTRGGREQAHEAALFFLLSGVALGLNALPQWFSRYVLDLQVPRLSPFGVEVAGRPRAVPAESAEDPDIGDSKAA
ncbi:GtrA family protein [Amycolatopsis sp. CA-126428]|uniref:GtrA family protein n=1 Tax=Amycolatopsis sp. CA-126428 TaxID=2073158 RepID=UPI000CD076C7|nr:GtrA family protein [Amycolatopsis sp. CA-126428]